MTHVSTPYSVAEAARELGVSESRVKALIAAGQIDAEKFAGRWMVDPESLQRRKNNSSRGGRPLSPQRIWSLISGPVLPELLRRSNPRVRDATRLQLGNRSDIHRVYAHPQFVEKIRPYILFPAGRELAESEGVPVGRDGRWSLDAYILARKMRELEGVGYIGRRGVPNVRLRVIDDDAMVTDLADRPIARLLVAWVDLVDDDDRAADMTLGALFDALGRRESTEPLDLATGENLAAGSLGRIVDALEAIAAVKSPR